MMDELSLCDLCKQERNKDAQARLEERMRQEREEEKELELKERREIEEYKEKERVRREEAHRQHKQRKKIREMRKRVAADIAREVEREREWKAERGIKEMTQEHNSTTPDPQTSANHITCNINSRDEEWMTKDRHMDKDITATISEDCDDIERTEL